GAADARDCPRARGAPAAAIDGRAFARTRAEAGDRDFSHAAATQRGRKDHPAGRAERTPSAPGRRLRLRHGTRPHRARGNRCEPARGAAGAAHLPWPPRGVVREGNFSAVRTAYRMLPRPTRTAQNVAVAITINNLAGE